MVTDLFVLRKRCLLRSLLLSLSTPALFLIAACSSDAQTVDSIFEVPFLQQAQSSSAHPIRSRIDPSKCVFVPSSTFANETQLQIAPCDGSASQAFVRNAEEITIGPNNSCIDVTEGKAQNGNPLQIYDCYIQSTNQRFARRSDGLIQWTGYNFCMSVSDPNAASGAAIVLQTCDANQLNQRWDFDVPVAEQLRNEVDTNKCLDVPSANFYDGHKLQIYDCNGSEAQDWVFDGGNITIGPHSMCLDVTDGVDTPGTLAQIYDCSSGNSNQQFLPRSDGLIQWTGYDLCLNLSGGNVTNGTAIDFQVCDPNQLSQHWNFGIYTPMAPLCKRGIAYGPHAEADLSSLSPSLGWWHNYAYQPELLTTDIYSALGLEFVPAAPGNDFDTMSYATSGYLLTFNQPAFHVQTDLTPVQAASLWPQVQSIADQQNLKIVGPALDPVAPTSGEISPFDWYDQFFASCANCRVDYVALHWKGCIKTDLQSALSAYETRYGKPLWVTEVSCSDPNVVALSDRLQYLQDAVSILEQDPNVFRYAWFTGRYTNEMPLALFGADGELTELGQAYRDAPGGCRATP